jgi:hypothetical protein
MLCSRKVSNLSYHRQAQDLCPCRLAAGRCRHLPAMCMIFVSDLLDSPGKIELEATAVVPHR